MHRTSQSEFRDFLLHEVASVKRGLTVLASSREVADDEIITAIQQYAYTTIKINVTGRLQKLCVTFFVVCHSVTFFYRFVGMQGVCKRQ